MIRQLCLLSVCLLGGCASIIEGTNQRILVNTNPSGADCGLYRKGIKLGTITQAPGSTLVDKTKNNIWIVCVKPGYQAATYLDKSGIAGGTFGNIIAGGGIGLGHRQRFGCRQQIRQPGQPDDGAGRGWGCLCIVAAIASHVRRRAPTCVTKGARVTDCDPVWRSTKAGANLRHGPPPCIQEYAA